MRLREAFGKADKPEFCSSVEVLQAVIYLGFVSRCAPSLTCPPQLFFPAQPRGRGLGEYVGENAVSSIVFLTSSPRQLGQGAQSTKIVDCTRVPRSQFQASRLDFRHRCAAPPARLSGEEPGSDRFSLPAAAGAPRRECPALRWEALPASRVAPHWPASGAPAPEPAPLPCPGPRRRRCRRERSRHER